LFISIFTCLFFIFFFFSVYGAHRYLHSFPTRRSSDLLFSLNRPFVQQSGPVTPLANGSHCGRKKRDGAAQELYLQHLAKLPYSGDRKSTRLNSSHVEISYAVFCLKKKKSTHCKVRNNN